MACCSVPWISIMITAAGPVMLFWSSSTYLPHTTTAADWERSKNSRDLDSHSVWAKSHSLPSQESQPRADIPQNIEILVAGVSRTGTSSMQAALQTFGYHTTHWQGYMIRYFDFVSHAFQGRISEPNLHQVFGDIPARGALLDCFVPILFDDLRRAYPNAQVILTTREPNSWLKSYENYVASCWLYHWTRHPILWFLSHMSRALRLRALLEPLNLLPSTRSGLDLDLLPELSEVFRKSDEVFYGSWQPSHLHMERRQRYEEHVKSTVPPSQLLIFDASKGDTLGKLASFLNVSVPSEVPLDNFPKLFDGNSVSSQGTQACILAHNAVLLTATGLASGVVFLVFLELLRGTVSWTRGATD